MLIKLYLCFSLDWMGCWTAFYQPYSSTDVTEHLWVEYGCQLGQHSEEMRDDGAER